MHCTKNPHTYEWDACRIGNNNTQSYTKNTKNGGANQQAFEMAADKSVAIVAHNNKLYEWINETIH